MSFGFGDALSNCLSTLSWTSSISRYSFSERALTYTSMVAVRKPPTRVSLWTSDEPAAGAPGLVGAEAAVEAGGWAAAPGEGEATGEPPHAASTRIKASAIQRNMVI